MRMCECESFFCAEGCTCIVCDVRGGWLPDALKAYPMDDTMQVIHINSHTHTTPFPKHIHSIHLGDVGLRISRCLACLTCLLRARACTAHVLPGPLTVCTHSLCGISCTDQILPGNDQLEPRLASAVPASDPADASQHQVCVVASGMASTPARAFIN